MTLLLRRSDVTQVLEMDSCLQALERAYAEQGAGRAVNRPRSHTYIPSEKPEYSYRFKSMEGGLQATGVVALRISSMAVRHYEMGGLKRQDTIPAAPGNRYVGLIQLYDINTTELLAIMPDGDIQRTRVGGTSALGAKLLARHDAQVVGLFGSGWQAATQLEGLCKVRDIREIKIFSPDREHRETFAKTMSHRLGTKVVAVSQPWDVVEASDIVVCATNSNEPVFDGDWLRPGMHVNSIVGGDATVPRRELDFKTIEKSNVILIHSKEHAKLIGQEDIFYGIHKSLFTWDDLLELPDLLLGNKPGRQDAAQITLFKNNVGLGIQFAAVANVVYQKARAAGLGLEVDSEYFTQDVKS